MYSCAATSLTDSSYASNQFRLGSSQVLVSRAYRHVGIPEIKKGRNRGIRPRGCGRTAIAYFSGKARLLVGIPSHALFSELMPKAVV